MHFKPKTWTAIALIADRNNMRREEVFDLVLSSHDWDYTTKSGQQARYNPVKESPRPKYVKISKSDQ